MQRSKLFTAIIFSIAIIISSFASVQAQAKKKLPPKGGGQSGQTPKPIGIQVADPVNRDNAKVQVQSAGIRQSGLNIVADVRWEAVAAQGSRLESFDVEVIGDFGNNTGVSEKRNFRGTATGGQLFLAEAAAHPASEFRSITAKVIANFRDLNKNEIFAKASVKSFPVAVLEFAPPTLSVPPVQVNGTKVFPRWNLTVNQITSQEFVVLNFVVTVTADLEQGQAINQQTQGRELRAEDRSTAFDFGQSISLAPRVAKLRTVVVASVRRRSTNGIEKITAERTDNFPLPSLPVVNLAVSDLKTSLNNLVSVNWTINGEAGSRILGFQLKLATTFSNDTAIISEFTANAQSRSFTRSFLPKDGPPNGFRQVFVTITAKMEETATGRKFDVVTSRKLN
ncbi:MAG: hypothetical protein AAB401_04425 [Acidobacteriota bacterium]